MTTVAPVSNALTVSQIDIGGNGAWTGGTYGGFSQVGGLGGSTGSNPARGFVFPDNLLNGNVWDTAEAASHESGHTMGLTHQSLYSGTTKTDEYYHGPGDGTAPIMGFSYEAVRGMWWYGQDSYSSTQYQNDMAVIASNGFGYRTSQAGNAVGTAAPLTVSGNTVSTSNIITSMSQLDYWLFVTGGGAVSFSVTAPPYGNLHPKFEIVDSLGNTVVGWQDPDASIVSWSGTLAAGSYRLVVASHGPSSLSTPTSYGFDVGSYSISGTISTPRLSGTGLNFSATAGAPFSGAVATFANADPSGGPGSYTATITWGDGNSSAGTITDAGGGTCVVSGSNTYADPNSYAVSVLIQHKQGYTTPTTTSGTATVTSLGIGVQQGQAAGIGFWHNKNGQALIQSFNGGATAMALANWLALTFPNLYGAEAGDNNLTGQTNAQVAAFYLTLFGEQGPKLDAQVLATALNVYATTLSLGGTAAQNYGFTVNAYGLGADSFSVGANGAAFGVVNNTTLNVYELLLAANKKAVGGVLYNGDKTLRSEAVSVFDAINSAGGI